MRRKPSALILIIRSRELIRNRVLDRPSIVDASEINLSAVGLTYATYAAAWIKIELKLRLTASSFSTVLKMRIARTESEK